MLDDRMDPFSSFVPEALDRLAEKASRIYGEQQTLTESPVEQVLQAFDFVIACGFTRDAAKATEIIQLLLRSLDDRDPELAQRFEQVYRHCLHLLSLGRFGEVIRIFRRLRDTWALLLKT